MKLTVRYMASVLAVLLAVLSFAAPSRAAGESGISAAGCKTEYYLMEDLFSAYREGHDVSVRLGSTGNKKAVELMLEEKVDFTFTCKPIEILAKKLKIEADRVSTWKSIPVAKDPIVVVANSEIGLKGLTLKQLADVFQGKVGNWKEVGGSDLPVVVGYLDPAIESGVVLLFKEFVVGSKGELYGGGRALDGPINLGNFSRSTPGAVTFMAYNSYKKAFGDILAIDGVEPSRASILEGTYGLTATYYLTVDEKRMDKISDFINFATGEGQKAIADNFIPLSE